LQPSATRVPIVLLQRVEEIIPAVRESLVSVVSRRESYDAGVWIDMAEGGKAFKGYSGGCSHLTQQHINISIY
jgi:hypothetical protein